MNFNVYLDDDTAKRLQEATELSNESRNAIIRKAITFWLNYSNKNRWADDILAFQGIEDFPAFESNRDDLTLPKDDPFL
jgi:predicted transcriptional regulator